uniref:BPTI/Kunitz inhibitor domain-containing protein n=1 Tax=Cyprinodon variegatus TaxID=28743 RepID=A0A3Q2CUA5_CYPVA
MCNAFWYSSDGGTGKKIGADPLLKNTLPKVRQLTLQEFQLQLPQGNTPCLDYALVWYFHIQSGECRPFVYGGCGGNQNRFPSRKECETLCVIKGGAIDFMEELPSDR